MSTTITKPQGITIKPLRVGNLSEKRVQTLLLRIGVVNKLSLAAMQAIERAIERQHAKTGICGYQIEGEHVRIWHHGRQKGCDELLYISTCFWYNEAEGELEQWEEEGCIAHEDALALAKCSI